MTKLPVILIYSRLVIGLFLFVLSFFHISAFSIIAVILISIGLLSDIFDGIIARRLGISTEKLRRLDSTIDQAFWLFITASAFVEHPSFFRQNYIQLCLLGSVELLAYVTCYIKFRKEIAIHAIASKLWTLILFSTLLQVILTGESTNLFLVCFYFGIISRLEIIAILFVLREWTNDIPSIYHAVLVRKGKVIKRNKLFNG